MTRWQATVRRAAWREALFLGVAGGCAALLLYQGILPLRKEGLCLSFLAFLLVAAALDRLGRLLARLLPGAGEAEALLLGLLGLSLLARLYSLLGILRPLPLGLTLILAAAESPRRWFFATRGLLERTAAPFRPRPDGTLFEWALAGIALLSLLFLAASVLPPPVAMDAMAYHLALPMRALARGAFANPFPQIYDSYLLLKEPADVFSLALDGSGRAAALLNLLALPLCAEALTRIAAAGESEDAAAEFSNRLLPPLLLFASPLAFVLIAHTKPDLFGYAALLLSFALYLEGRDLPAAFWAGVALLAKMTGVFLLAPILAALLFQSLRARRPGGAAFIAVLGGWPLLFLLFGSPLNHRVSDFYSPSRLAAFVSFFSLHVPAALSAPLTPLALPFFLLALFRRAPRGGNLLLGVAFLLWLLSGAWARYAAPVFLAGAALGVGAVSLRGRPARAIAAGILLLSTLAGIRIVSLRMDVLGYLSGRIDAAHYRAPWQTTAPLLEAAGRVLPPEAGRGNRSDILLHGEYRIFPLGRDAWTEDYSDTSIFWDIAHSAAKVDADELLPIVFRMMRFHWFLDCSSVRLGDIERGLTPAPESPRDIETLRAFLATRRILLRDEDGNALYDLTQARDTGPLPEAIPIPRVEVRPGRDEIF